MTRSIARAFGHALLLCAALPLSAAAQTPSSSPASPAPAPVATPGPPQIAFPGQYALAPADWRFPVWPSSCRRFEGGERVACLDFVASDYGRLARFSAANAALDRFTGLNAEIIALSHRNTNVRSLALSLGKKRTLTSACEDSLRALQDALTKREFKSTR